MSEVPEEAEAGCDPLVDQEEPRGGRSGQDQADSEQAGDSTTKPDR